MLDSFRGTGTLPSDPSARMSRRGRRAERAAVDRPAPRDAADVLAGVYALILNWPTPEERAAARPESADEAAAGGDA